MCGNDNDNTGIQCRELWFLSDRILSNKNNI